LEDCSQPLALLISSRNLCAASALISSAFPIASRSLSLVPSLSASAETLGTNEIPVKEKWGAPAG
jgi:hypothetical protein